ncbi:murein L,D-transpeptidase catalytic domain family protein [Rhodanobacter caeni]|uniref:Murein L,D-transpeptidase catalytic domain family protein n=2 Tax=Rhodanobacter caeni TaxID=657654 RepID=A0ABP3EJ56_9GAMM
MSALALTALACGAASASTASTEPAVRSVGLHSGAAQRLARVAPAIDPQVLSLALAAVQCAQASGVGMAAQRLAVIDYSMPSLQRRLWVFDLRSHRLLYREWVAHGSGSGGNLPTHFSNEDGSHASSVGLFVTGDTYIGRNGYSLRMDGLEPGFNDAAMDRAIVMHGADYVNATADQAMGRLGRSWGCPALRSAVARPIIDVMKDGQFVFAYYPEQAWLARSALLHCPAAQLALAAERSSH